MGVPGFVNLLKNRGRGWTQNYRLRDCKLIVDCTDGMYWFVKMNLLKGRVKMDRFGFSMVGFGTFMHSFFDLLAQANVKPIVVYNGARLKESQYGEIISKKIHLDKSSRIRMFLLNKNGAGLDHDILPTLCENVIKQVINERHLDHAPVQSLYEVYPMLKRLSEENDCPVLTSHSDFILSSVNRGFILAEEFKMDSPNPNMKEIAVPNLYQHRSMLGSYNLGQQGPALSTLYALLRPDFQGTHPNELNQLFRPPQHLRFRADDGRFVQGRRRHQRQPMGSRLSWILENWPRHLTTEDSVRRALASVSNRDVVEQYDALYRTFSDPIDFAQGAPRDQLLPERAYTVFDVPQALAARESSSTFLLDLLMSQTNFNRGCLEDVETPVSSYSLQDRAKQSIMATVGISSVQMLDRRYSSLLFRQLHQEPQLAADGQLDQLIYGKVFEFPGAGSAAQLSQLKDSLKIGSALRVEASEQLLVILMLARFAVNFGQVKEMESYKNLIPIFYRAVYNAFFYHVYESQAKRGLLDEKNLNQDPKLVDPQDSEKNFYPQLRVACNEMKTYKIQVNPDISNQSYIQMKHLIELLNASLHAYCELNSLFNYPCTRLHLTHHYDGVLIYKIMRHLLTKSPTKDALLHIEPSLNSLLIN